MVKQTISILLVFSIFFGIASSIPLFGQASKTQQEKKLEKVKSEIKKHSTGHATVKVKLYSGTTYLGSISEVNDQNFVILDEAGISHTVKNEDVNSIGGKGISSGLKIALGAAIGAGAVLAVLGIIIASDN